MINLETPIRPPVLRRLRIHSDLVKRRFDLMIRVKVALILYLLAQGVTVIETPFREVGTPVAGEGGLARFGVLGEVFEEPACDVVFGFHGGVEGLACGDGFVEFGVGGWGVGGCVDGERVGGMVYGCVFEGDVVGEVREGTGVGREDVCRSQCREHCEGEDVELHAGSWCGWCW